MALKMLITYETFMDNKKWVRFCADEKIIGEPIEVASFGKLVYTNYRAIGSAFVVYWVCNSKSQKLSPLNL